ncbi:MAG: linear amide C-N hydrolase [Clostridiales bacterium]|nr:linear amide C-N hydrolase [Clostridiales bacterium]
MDIIVAVMPKFATFLTSVLIFINSVTGSFTPQINTMKNITKICDGYYVMDCDYDYDALEILEKGVDNTVDLLYSGLKTVFTKRRGFGCTTFNSVTKSGDYLLSRNFDYMDSPALLVRTTPKNGYASLSTVSLYFLGYELDPEGDFAADNSGSNIATLLAPFLALDGINEKGFAIGVLELETKPTFQVSLKPNLTTTSMIRACLDNAATVDEAVKIFRSHDMRDLLFDECKYHFQLSDANGESAIIEYYKNKMHVIYPEKNKNNRVNYQAATNFHLIECADDPDGMGQDRYLTVMSKLKKTRGILSEKQAMNLLKKVSMKDADLHGYICSTLWSNVFNMSKKTVSVCCFNNYNRKFTFSVSKPLLDQVNK